MHREVGKFTTIDDVLPLTDRIKAGQYQCLVLLSMSLPRQMRHLHHDRVGASSQRRFQEGNPEDVDKELKYR
jgi:hypothetical protein